MPNERSRRRAARRVRFLPRLRLAPVLLLGLIAVAVIGVTPQTDAPLRWTVRDANGWMTEFDALRQTRSAMYAAANPAAPRGDRLAAVATPSAPFGRPAASLDARLVVAEADLPPRDERKRVPVDVVDPDITGALPNMKRLPATNAPSVTPSVNRSGKSDRLLAPQPVGRSTDRDLFVKPTLAAVPPSQEGWPPLMTMASMIAPQSGRTLPRLALAAPDKTPVEGRLVLAMVRTGPGKVVTQSAIAALGDRDKARASGRPLLPPVPEAQVAKLSPRTTVWAQPPVPEIGYARRATDGILARFRAVLGDEPEPQPKTLAEEAAEMGP